MERICHKTINVIAAWAKIHELRKKIQLKQTKKLPHLQKEATKENSMMPDEKAKHNIIIMKK